MRDRRSLDLMRPALAFEPLSARLDPMPSGQALASASLEDLVERIRAEFIEQPGLRLTTAQGCRLWRLDPSTLQVALAALTDAAFLSRSADGRFTRRSVV